MNEKPGMTDFSIVPNLSPEHTLDHDYCVDEESYSFGSDVDSAFSALEEVIPELKAKTDMAEDGTFEEVDIKFIQNQLGSLIKEEKIKKIVNAMDNRDVYIPFMDQVYNFGNIGLYGMDSEKTATEEATRSNEAQPLSRQIDFATLFGEKGTPTISVTRASSEGETVLSAPTAGIHEPVISTDSITSITTSSPLFVLKAGEVNVSEEALQTTLSFIGSVAEQKGLSRRGTLKAPSALSVYRTEEKTRFTPYPKEKPQEDISKLNLFFGTNDEELIKKFSSLKNYITSTDSPPTYSRPVDVEGPSTMTSDSSRKLSVSPESAEATSTSTEPNTVRSRSASRNSCSCRKPRLYHFLFELLESPEKYKCIEWVDKSTGIFKFLQSAEVARLWGQRKNKPNMKYENFARSLRTYVAKNILRKPRNKLVYQFVTPPSDDGSD